MFSKTENNSFFKLCNERYVVFLERAMEISKEEYELIFEEQFYMNELQQITWCISTKQKHVIMSDSIIANYAKVFDYSFDFNSKWVDKDLERKTCPCFNQLSEYKKLPVICLITYHRYLNESKLYLQGQFYFNWLELQ